MITASVLKELRLNRSGEKVKRPTNKLYLLEVIEEYESMGNKMEDVSILSQREGVVLEDVKTRYRHS